MKIKIPEGEYCGSCTFQSFGQWSEIRTCLIFNTYLDQDEGKCPQCLNHEPVIVEYEGKKEYENKTE